MKSLEDIVKPYKERLEGINYRKIPKDFSPTIYLFQSWAYKVGKGWYGFDLEGVPFVWAQIIDDFLKELIKVAPDFEIHQVKIKMGGLRFHVDLHIDDAQRKSEIFNEIEKLGNLLHNEGLIY